MYNRIRGINGSQNIFYRYFVLIDVLPGLCMPLDNLWVVVESRTWMFLGYYFLYS